MHLPHGGFSRFWAILFISIIFTINFTITHHIVRDAFTSGTYEFIARATLFILTVPAVVNTITDPFCRAAFST
jgi:hypothetical protein